VSDQRWKLLVRFMLAMLAYSIYGRNDSTQLWADLHKEL